MIITIAGFASAQISGLSSQCKGALSQVAASPEAGCINPAGLVPIATNPGSTPDALDTQFNNWLSGLCSVGSCSNQTIAEIVTNVTSGCSSELNTFGIGTGNVQEEITFVQQLYPVARQISCLKDTSTGDYCGTVIITAIPDTLSGGSLTVPTNVTCGDCSKAALTIIQHEFPSSVESEDSNNSSLHQECGDSFFNGQMPSDVQQTAKNGSYSSGNDNSGALSVSFAAGTALLTAFASALALV